MARTAEGDGERSRRGGWGRVKAQGSREHGKEADTIITRAMYNVGANYSISMLIYFMSAAPVCYY